MGGHDSKIAFPAINIFLPLANSWVRIMTGDLPQPQDYCTAVQLSSNTMSALVRMCKQPSLNSAFFLMRWDLIALLESVGEYCSWFNHSLLRLIIDACCEENKAIKKAHQDYCAHLQKYCKHRVKKFPFKNRSGNGGKNVLHPAIVLAPS